MLFRSEATGPAPPGEDRVGGLGGGQSHHRVLVELRAASGPQSIPAGELVTVPEPLLVTVIVSFPVKLAETDLAALMVTEQELVPKQPAPLHPVKTELAPGAAVRVTTAFLSNCALQVGPQ